MENKMKFEEKIHLLETIVDELEKDDIKLDDSIEKYAKAMKLIQECDSELKQVEEKVSKIVTEDGSVQNFELEN